MVAKNYTQQESIDYDETFSSIVRLISTHLFLAIVAHLDLELYQMDVKISFLNGELDEEIYMQQLVCLIKRSQESKVCKLTISIYGLKLFSSQWYLRFDKAVIFYNFVMLDENHCIYLKMPNENFVIFSLYVDDVLLIRNDKEYVKAIKKWLPSKFEMKDVSETDYILAVKIYKDHLKRLLVLSQEPYIKKILEHLKMENCNPFDTCINRRNSKSSHMS